METKNSPFLASIFQEIWKKHFIANKQEKSFKFIDGLSFYKSSSSIFINIGKNLTKGGNYHIYNYEDYKNKTFLVYDVLPHLVKKTMDLPPNIGILKSIQYPGFLINLDNFKNIDDYLLNTFSKNTRMKMRKFSKRLEDCFEISTKMFFGQIDKKEYDRIFENFMVLLQKRYSEKEVLYNNMQPTEWNFYKEVAYPLILENKASLFVVFNKETPIAITYSYHTKDSLIDAITVFDIDYSKFNLGYVNNLKLVNWCFENKLKTLDFSKGYFDYKKRMCTLEYNFEYHIIYDKKSIKSKLLAHFYFNFLEFKTYLRNKKLDVKFHELTYKLKNKSSNNLETTIKTLDTLPNNDALLKIDSHKVSELSFLTKHINDFLYLVVKPLNEIEIFKLNGEKETYIFSSHSLIQEIKILK